MERNVFMEEVRNQKTWNFHSGTEESINVPIWINIGFQQQDRQNSQNLNNDNFCWLPVISAQGFIGTEKQPDSTILLNYKNDNYSQGYGKIKEVFRALTGRDTLKSNITEHDYRLSNKDFLPGHHLYVLDERYQKNVTFFQPNIVEFKFDEVVPG